MMRSLRELERVEWRALGALRFVDATTGMTVQQPLVLDAPGARFIRNSSACYVLRTWDKLTSYTDEFLTPPALPAVGSLTLKITVTDPEGTYLPIVCSLPLPRSADPANANAADSVFRAQSVPLYPASIAPTGANWAVLRVTLTETDTGDALGGALLRIFNASKTFAQGLTDWRGEALLPVVGVPVTTFSEAAGAVVISEISVNLRAAFDPTTGSRTPVAAVRKNQPPPVIPSVDPVALGTNFETLPNTPPLALSIAARRSQTVSLTLDLP